MPSRKRSTVDGYVCKLHYIRGKDGKTPQRDFVFRIMNLEDFAYLAALQLDNFFWASKDGGCRDGSHTAGTI